MKIRNFQRTDEIAVIALWTECELVVPHNDPRRDIQRKLSDSPELFLVGEVDGRVVATVMVGYEGHRGWINYLAVSPALQKTGCGREIMEYVESLLKARGCPKINLQVRSTHTPEIEFYQRLGYSVDNVVSMGKRLIADAL